jgi:hypothetical protein
MPIVKANSGNPIAGVIVPNAAQRNACQDVIAQLVFADLGRGAGTLHTVGVARLDMQGHNAAGAANLQVQIGNSTVACALVAGSIQAMGDAANQRGGAAAAISALNQSLDSGTIWNVTGSVP